VHSTESTNHENWGSLRTPPLFFIRKKMYKEKRMKKMDGGMARKKKGHGGRMMYKDGGMPKAKPC